MQGTSPWAPWGALPGMLRRSSSRRGLLEALGRRASSSSMTTSQEGMSASSACRVLCMWPGNQLMDDMGGIVGEC